MADEIKTGYTLVKGSERKMRHVSDPATIRGMIDKYVNLNDLFFHNINTSRSEPVVFLQHSEDAGMVCQFPCYIESDEVKIFSIVSDRYVELRMENITGEDDLLGMNTYRLKIKNCLLAMDKRAYPRYMLDKGECTVDNITVSKYNETPKDLSSAVFARILIKEYTDRLSGYETKTVVMPGDEQTREVIYARKTGHDILCNGDGDIETLVSEKTPLIREKIGEGFPSELKQSMSALYRQIGSYMVLPIEYTTTGGKTFPLGFIVMGRTSSPISGKDYDDARKGIEFLSEKIRKANYMNQKCRGDVMDISAGGCRIIFPDTDSTRNLLKKNEIIFDLIFDVGDPIRVNGTIVHIARTAENEYSTGVSITGSQYGPDFERIFMTRLKKLREKS